MKVFRLGHLSVNALHWILAEEHRDGVNADRVPPGAIRLSVYPGEEHILTGEDAREFRRQLDEMFPRPGRTPDRPGPRPTIAGRAIDPETGRPESAGDEAVEGG